MVTDFKVIIKILVILFNLNSVYTKDLSLKLNDTCLYKPTNKKGVCLLLKDCQETITILNEETLPQTCEFRTGVSSSADPIVCCPRDIEDKGSVKINKSKESLTNRLSVKKCDEYSSEVINLIHIIVARIAGGANASKGEFPHMAALGYGSSDNIQWLCGGTLISDQYVVTAAHCTASTIIGEVSFVQLGSNVLLRQENLGDRFIYTVTDKIVHDNYKPPSNYHDIALLKLDRKVEFTALIKPACLHTETNFGDIKSFEATGWGLTSFGGNQSDVLLKVTLDVFDQDVCAEIYKTVPDRKLEKGIIDSQFCAGNKNSNDNIGRNTCTGDSGGPLQYFNYSKSLHYIVGITSFGKFCGNSPGVYTKVSSYVDWIENIVWSNRDNV